MGGGMPRLRLSPLQGQLLRFLEEAGAEELRTTVATYARPGGAYSRQDLDNAIAGLVGLGFIRLDGVNAESLEIVLTNAGRSALQR
jgi:hypothetical protein